MKRNRTRHSRILIAATAGVLVAAPATGIVGSAYSSAPSGAGVPVLTGAHLWKQHGKAARANAVGDPWAGKVFSNASFTSIRSTWTVPTLSCTSTVRSSYAWVGLGGWAGGQALEQIGTVQYCSGGTARYGIFKEFYSTPPQNIYDDPSYPIGAGDSVTGSVTSTATPGRYTLKLVNHTEGWTLAQSGSSPDYDATTDPGNATAEVVMEPADGGNVHYADTTFTDIGYTTSSGSVDSELLDDVHGGTTLATTTSSGGDEITVHWMHS